MASAKVLIVDDDKKTVELVSLYLKKDGYHVLAAYDGQQAIELARRKQPDLIVLDLMLLRWTERTCAVFCAPSPRCLSSC